jgi:multiple sugar transport system substrate-binding protein
MSRRRFLAGSAVVAGTAALPLVSSCSAAPKGGSAAGGKTTLTVMYASNELTKDHIAAFEQLHPDITIQFIENDDTRLNAMLSSGSPPDFVRGAAIGSANFNARGLAENLDPYLDASTVLHRDDLLPVNDSWRWDGKRSGQGPFYGFTKDWSQDATLWYNAAQFQRAGVPPLSTTVPTSYDDLLEIGRKLTVLDGGRTQVYGLGVEWAWGIWAPITTMIMQQGASLYNAELTRADFTSPAAKRAFQWYVDFAKAGIGPTSLNPLPDGADLSTFNANRMAISQDGYWYGGNFTKAPAAMKDGLRMAPAPVMGDKRFSPCYAGQGAWIPAASKNKDAAWKLMEFFMAGPPAEERASSGWGMPALKSLLAKLPQTETYQKLAYETTQAELAFNGPLPDSPYVSVTSWNTLLDTTVQQAVTGKLTVDAACQQVTTEINKLLAQGKDQIG